VTMHDEGWVQVPSASRFVHEAHVVSAIRDILGNEVKAPLIAHYVRTKNVMADIRCCISTGDQHRAVVDACQNIRGIMERAVAARASGRCGVLPEATRDTLANRGLELDFPVCPAHGMSAPTARDVQEALMRRDMEEG